MEKKKSVKKRRKYDENFKGEILKMIDGGKSVQEVSQTFGIGENLVYKWRSESKSSLSPSELSRYNEIESLKKQLKIAETERDILKKAIAIFGKAN
ncbi:MAG: transposase [Spirosomataceae bacterium]|jgi:transposase